MATDRYTKAVLTIIAGALVALAAQNATRDATAQAPLQQQCTVISPCFVTNASGTPLYVVDVTPKNRDGTLRGIPPSSGKPK